VGEDHREGVTLEEQIGAARADLRHLLDSLGPSGDRREELERLASMLDAAADRAARDRATRAAEADRLDAILEVLYALAVMDFTRRADISGDSPLDALAASANMVAEELEAAHTAMLKAKAEAEAATAAKSQFLAHMSHEIRTPLTALIGFARLLAARSVSESDRLNYAMIISRNGEHLLSVINSILDLSKIEAGKLTVEHIDCSPAQILSEVASFMRVRAIEAGLEFSVELESPIPAVIRSDPTRLRQSLLNLVSNAIKFTPRGSVRVIGGFDTKTSPPRLSIHVKDTGMGMRREQVDTLFQPFEQLDSSMSRKFGGTGLGLAICKRLARALGGDVEVISAVSEGSTFTLTTAADVPAGTPMIERLVDSPSPSAAGPMVVAKLAGRVLLAEDGPDNQKLVTTLLGKSGLTVTVVSNGQLALDAALGTRHAATPFDAILMDMQMPVMDGYEAVSRLRHEGYQGPIIALTAHAMDGERERCLAAGCDDYVRKPIDHSELVSSLAKYLRAEAPDVGLPLTSSFADDPDMVELVRRFAASLPERAAAMKEAAGTAVLPRLVHQLKGAAGGYGYAEITTAAARLEDALAKGTVAVGALLDELCALCARVVAP
jgi:signal transduction histidine kinase/CheY-like chemotaxis protein